MALDIGEKRIGVAVSDATARIASPLKVLDAARVLGDGAELRRILDDYEVDLVVVGLPLSMDGTEGPQSARVRAVISKLAGFMLVPVEFVDERLSSAQASRSMSEAGMSQRQQRGKLDSVAAALFLQAYLDARRPVEDA